MTIKQNSESEGDPTQKHGDRTARAEIELAEGLSVNLPAKYIGGVGGSAGCEHKDNIEDFQSENHFEDDDDR